MADLLAEPAELTSWIVEGLLPADGLSILAGKPKAGKSTLARCLALSVARGDPVLGRLVVQGPVVYLALEDKRAEITEHFRAMGALDEPLLIHTGPAPPDSKQAVEQLSDLIQEHKPCLIVIDTMLRFIRVRDTSSYAEMTAALGPLLYLARDAGCHVLVVYHAGKQDREGLDAILGSVAIAGSCDTGMILQRRGGNVRTLTSQQRYGVDLPETILELDPDTRVVRAQRTLVERNNQDLEQSVLDFMGSKELTEVEIRQGVGGHTGKVGKALRCLVKDRRVSRAGKGKSGDPYKYSMSRF